MDTQNCLLDLNSWLVNGGIVMSEEVSKTRGLNLLKKLTIVEEWDVAKWAYKEAWKMNNKNIIFWTILNIIGALIPIFVLKTTEYVVNTITTAVEVDADLRTVGLQVVALCLLWVLQSSYNIIPGIIKYTMQTRYSIGMQRKYATFVNKVPLGKFDNKKFSDQISHVGVTCNRIAYFVGGTSSFIGTFVGTVGLMWLAFSTSWIFLVIGLVAFAVALTLSTMVMEETSNFWFVAKMERRKQQYYSGLISSRETGKEIRAMRLGDFFRGRWRGLVEKLTDMEVDLDVRTKRIYNVLAFMRIVFGITILAVGLWLLSRGDILIGALVMLWQLNSQLLNSVQRLVNDYHYPISYMPVLKEQKEVFDMVFDEIGLPTREKRDIIPKKPREIFALKNVSFGYQENQEVLKNISLTIEKGETIALVGDNGAGKSTLIKLLLGLYVPNQGEIFFEGLPYDQLTQEYLYSKLGVVFQDFKQYHFTIRENIAFGDISQMDNDQVLMEAARKGQAEKLINAQAKGLDTYLGRQFETDGIELSGGEWQRIGVSRAHVSDKEVLILDEPAAKLDPVSEMEQFMEIKNSLGGRTAVLVSHRLGFARLADEIIVLSDGDLVETGTHEQLMKANGHYATMFKAQAEWYEGSVSYNGDQRAN